MYSGLAAGNPTHLDIKRTSPQICPGRSIGTKILETTTVRVYQISVKDSLHLIRI